MGEYVMTDGTVNGKPVYNSSKPNQFLFMDSRGKWCVGLDSGKDRSWLAQRSKHSLGPDPDVQWEYCDRILNPNGRMKDDFTLKAYAWQI